jgi:hypothetical protein
MIKEGHIGAACAFRDLGYPPEMVKVAFMNQGLTAEEADYLVKEAWIGAAIKGIGSLLGHIGGKGTQLAASGMGRAVAGGAERVGAGILKNTPNKAGMNFLKTTPGAMAKAAPQSGAVSGSATGKLMQGGTISKGIGGALHHLGAGAQRGLAGFQGGGILGGLKHIGGGALNFGKGMFFMGSKNPSLLNMAGKGYGAYGMGSMLLQPGSTPMPSPQMQG